MSGDRYNRHYTETEFVTELFIQIRKEIDSRLAAVAEYAPEIKTRREMWKYAIRSLARRAAERLYGLK